VEFTGPTVSEWSLSSRITVAHMAAEISAEFALFQADQKVIDYVHSRTRETPRDILRVGGQHVFGNILGADTQGSPKNSPPSHPFLLYRRGLRDQHLFL
jgi:hypothetical protein